MAFVIISNIYCHGFAVPNDNDILNKYDHDGSVCLLRLFSLMLSEVKINCSQKETRTKHFKELFILREI